MLLQEFRTTLAGLPVNDCCTPPENPSHQTPSSVYTDTFHSEHIRYAWHDNIRMADRIFVNRFVACMKALTPRFYEGKREFLEITVRTVGLLAQIINRPTQIRSRSANLYTAMVTRQKSWRPQITGLRTKTCAPWISSHDFHPQNAGFVYARPVHRTTATRAYVAQCHFTCFERSLTHRKHDDNFRDYNLWLLR